MEMRKLEEEQWLRSQSCRLAGQFPPDWDKAMRLLDLVRYQLEYIHQPASVQDEQLGRKCNYAD